MTISDLITFLWREDFSCIQLNALILINSYISAANCKIEVLKELNLQNNRSIIARYVLKNANKTGNEDLAHQVYVYQTYVLR